MANDLDTRERDGELEDLLAEALGPHDDAAAPPELAERILAATAGRVTARRRPVLARLGGRAWVTAAMAAALMAAVGLWWQLAAPRSVLPLAETPVAVVESHADTHANRHADTYAWMEHLDLALGAITATGAHGDPVDAELAMLSYDIDRWDDEHSLADAAAALDELLWHGPFGIDDAPVGLF
jgi:hypothetical protein